VVNWRAFENCIQIDCDERVALRIPERGYGRKVAFSYNSKKAATSTAVNLASSMPDKFEEITLE
jgi:hypothetical protein